MIIIALLFQFLFALF
jgi:hypothetical protein